MSQVRTLLEEKFAPITIITASDLSRFGLSAEWSGWGFHAEGRGLAVAVDASFPYSVPKVFVLDDRYALRPHVEKRNRLCLSEDGAGVDTDEPYPSGQGRLVT